MSDPLRQKITAPIAADFIATSEANERLWDTELGSFHLLARGGGKGSWRVKYRAPDGRPRVITIGRYPEMAVAMARNAARTKLNDAIQGVDPLAAKEAAKAEAKRLRAQTVKAYLDGHYSVYLGRRKTGKETIQMIERSFGDWLSRPMPSLTRQDLMAWQNEREKSGAKFGTISREWDAMRAMLNHAAKAGLIDSNPLKGAKPERPALSEEELAEAGTARRYLSAEEVTAFFAGLDAYQEMIRTQRRNSRAHGKRHLPDLDGLEYADHVKPWLMMMFYTGFRPGDLFGLRWEHVNLPFKTIRKVIEKTAHHKPEPQTFPISEQAANVLAAWHKQKGKPASGYVFASPVTGGRMDKGAMQKPWYKVRDAGGLPAELHLYTLRHNFASTLVMNGVDLLTVSRLMAHTDINTTIEHYGHLQPNRAREVVNAFADLFEEKRPEAAPGGDTSAPSPPVQSATTLQPNDGAASG